LLRAGLREHASIDTASSSPKGWQALAGDYDVVILDVRCQRNRLRSVAELRRGIHVPVLMLTRSMRSMIACVASPRRRRYLTKPFAFREARWRASGTHSRRSARRSSLRLGVADLEVDLVITQCSRRAAGSLSRPRSSRCSSCCCASGEVVDPHDHRAHLGHQPRPFANVLDVLVRRLRSKVDDDSITN